jgi:hypothetical protein
MKTMSYIKHNTIAAAVIVAALSATAISPAAAQSANDRPALIITTDPVPDDLKSQIYTKPVQVREIQAKEVVSDSYYSPEETLVTRKINELATSLSGLQANVAALARELSSSQAGNVDLVSSYYADVATIRAQLQSGTTPGNPRLLGRIDRAETNLGALESGVQGLNQLAVDAANIATEASYLLESARSAYSLSGAVEEDHVKLAELEDTINATVVIIERVLTNVNEDLSRTAAYLSAERNNLRTLTLAVAKGDLYGQSFANQPYVQNAAFSADAGMSGSAPVMAPSGRPLVKIRFDRPDVNYEQPLYTAVNEALERYPDARFSLVAVHPSRGNAAEKAIESTRSRRNAERVLRTLNQMGLPADRVALSYNESPEATSNEVHLLVQ